MFNKSTEQDIKKTIKSIKLNKVVTSVMFVILGVLLLVWPGAALSAVCKLLGIALAVGGLIAVILYLVEKERTFVSVTELAGGVIVFVLGMWLFLNPEFLIALVPTIVGLFIIISGIVNLTEAVTIKKEGSEGASLALVLAIITLAFGLLIFFNPAAIANFIVRIMGIALVYNEVSNLIIISKITGKIKETEQIINSVDVTEASARSAEKQAQPSDFYSAPTGQTSDPAQSGTDFGGPSNQA